MINKKTEANDKAQRRNRRQRNLVHKNNKHRGGAHTSNKYVRPKTVPGSWIWEY